MSNNWEFFEILFLARKLIFFNNPSLVSHLIWNLLQFNLTPFRLVNMVHLTQKDHGIVWNIVKQSWIKYFKSTSGGYAYEKDCPFRSFNGILKYSIIRSNIRNVENSLNLNESETNPYGEVSSLDLQTAAEMFIYLTHCPSPEYYKLIDFMEYLFTSESLVT